MGLLAALLAAFGPGLAGARAPDGSLPRVRVATAESLGLAPIPLAPHPQSGFPRKAWVDTKTGARLEATYGVGGGLEELAEYSPGGALKDRRELRRGIVVLERWSPGYRRVEIRPSGPDHYEITVFDSTQTPAKRTVVRKAAEIASRCLPSSGTSASLELMSNLSTLRFAGEGPARADGSTELGHNLVARGCAAYPWGGLTGLADELTSAYQRGAACLRDHGRTLDAARLLAVMDEGFGDVTIDCARPGEPTPAGSLSRPGVLATAVLCSETRNPGMILNVGCGGDCGGALERQKTLFHESLHWLGYSHGYTYDLPYVAETCCFDRGAADGAGPVEAAGREAACSILGPEVTEASAEYGPAFARMMALGGREGIGVEAVLNQVNRGPVDSATGRRDLSALFEAGMRVSEMPEGMRPEDWVAQGSPLLGSAMALAATVSASDDATRALRTAAIARMTEFYSDLPRPRHESASQRRARERANRANEQRRGVARTLAYLIQSSTLQGSYRVQSAWQGLSELRPGICSVLTRREQVQVEEAVEGVNMAIFSRWPTQSLPDGMEQAETEFCPPR
ncbi:MAG: hypothetical protein IT285_03455 [Bdellovibrionales bacterium]|nr:hypothetical protein [Bdellovibrionales bacterium]